MIKLFSLTVILTIGLTMAYFDSFHIGEHNSSNNTNLILYRKIPNRIYAEQSDSILKFNEVESVGKQLVNQFLTTEHLLHNGKWIHYAEVCTWLGATRFAQSVRDTVLLLKLQERFDVLMTSESDLLPVKNHVDLNMFGCLPLEFYEITGDRKYFEMGIPYAITQWEIPNDATPEQQEFASDGYSWQTRLWIDDMYMITIIQSQAYRATGDRKYIDRAAQEMAFYLNRLQRPNGLFFHAPDVPFYWARGNGWMAAGMTELLKALPEDNLNRDVILDAYLKMMKSLKEHQGKNGLWNQLVDHPDFWTETSGSAMFTYALITGLQRGWLDEAEYGQVVEKAWNAMTKYINDKGEVREVCVGTNKQNDLEYYRNRPRITGDFHGQAPYLWCATALLEWSKTRR
ncbi:glycoside hydrolase family 88/105 protein [Mangrovibacterium diazotrophicum]|uniref:Rhamnogalacturonyl hydrolase YesR n=1 Tax=Mangrovibacterium diazotrophicum TaxID=1261403 RepID=A0A419W4F7_9BACT|nr:glycoside hydrolase family 88 protein [Mangrovibacterium diazotrophicum]RKD90344.1 rhamnogalacturonyl hydrolase YesR [Mangrovibacterium diazotrophicum]